MKTVDNSYLGSSDEANILMEKVKATFINDFSNSNSKDSTKSLRPKATGERHSVTFSSGSFAGCFIALLVSIILRIEARNVMEKEGASYMGTELSY
ncbi:Phosphate transporter PHO1-like protein [Melia azedarach]|uniref:Phosphate transporter PHO1-like protein n=1 Tax=Melia azedarach TaxID=155640 RepID=A0ACC1XK96_MELAZ|nr:Phosphate transporter PHO1-like protein [Melia azedarach]